MHIHDGLKGYIEINVKLIFALFLRGLSLLTRKRNRRSMYCKSFIKIVDNEMTAGGFVQ